MLMKRDSTISGVIDFLKVNNNNNNSNNNKMHRIYEEINHDNACFL
jgi:hypothetical protein